MMRSQCLREAGLMSGWYWRESSLKAFRISCLDAPLGSCRTSKGLQDLPSWASRQEISKASIITLIQLIFKLDRPLYLKYPRPYCYSPSSLPPYPPNCPTCLFLPIRVNNGMVCRGILIMLTTQQQEKVLGGLLQKKENSLCADCNGKSPCWASLDFGVFVCMNCSGAHRFLGPTTTRVRSTKLDTWNKDWVENMRIGNTVLNEYWQHGLTGINRTAKPTINSSLNDIIKFVQDKYLKKKYVDPEQPLDPLKRSKLPPEPKSQIVHQKPPPQKVPPKPQGNNISNDSPFNAFSNILASKQKQQRKSSDNLISFEKEPVNLMQKGAEVVHQPQKYNHAQFHTISGSKPKEEEQFISFEHLVNANEPAKQQVPAHNNYLLNPTPPSHFHGNAGHYSTGHFGNHPQQYHQQYDRAQYVTMNINMNMYPKVMNINMNPQTNYLPQNNTNPYLPQQAPQNTFANQLLGHSPPPPQKQSQNEVTITLDSNISLQTTLKKEKEEPKSWIDEWK